MAPPPSSKSHNDLPDHLLHKKILPHLPFKYLNRLKCVSKELNSLISTDAKFAADQSCSADTSSSGFVYMTDGILSFFPDPILIGVPDPSLNFLNPTSSNGEIKLITCTNGLLLLIGEFNHKESLCVCNPATKEMVFVPKRVSWENKYFVYKMGLAYDPCELPDRFTIVSPVLRDTHLYQFNVFCSDTGKWTCSSTGVYLPSYSATIKAVYAKGVIYWCCGEYLLWYDTKRDLAGSIMRPLIKPLIEFHIGVYADDITCCQTWVGGIDMWRLTGGSHWDRFHAISWDIMLDEFNFYDGMQLCHISQYEILFFKRYSIYLVGFDGRFVYITVQLKEDQINKSRRFFRWEIEIGRVEEIGDTMVHELWYINGLFKYANSMAKVPQILNETPYKIGM